MTKQLSIILGVVIFIINLTILIGTTIIKT